MRISDWSSDVCSSDLHHLGRFTSHESPVTNHAIKSARARAEFGAAEEVRDLVLRVVEAVRTVNRVLVDRVGEVGANRAFVGLLRIGGPHDLAIRGNRVQIGRAAFGERVWTYR